MLPVFSNPTGLYALLGIPLVLAIHFLQHKSRKISTSTLFLIEILIPDSRTGRMWEKLRNSLTLWMQILFVLLLAWVLSQPRWIKENFHQTVVFVMDDSLRMKPFKEDAISAVKKDISTIKSSKIPTLWILMTSSSRRTPLYRGENTVSLLNTLDSWEPKYSEHDPVPALRAAESAVAGNGFSRFITYKEARVPFWQAAIGVGKIIDNAGFVGIIPENTGANSSWRVAIKNHSPKTQHRELIVSVGESSSKQNLSLNPNSVMEIKASLPPESDSMVLSLSPDEFGNDDTITLVKNTPKDFSASLSITPEKQDFFSKLVQSIPGVRIEPLKNAGLLITELDSLNSLPEIPSVIFSKTASKEKTLKAPIFAEPCLLTKDLSWGGLLFSNSGTLETNPQSHVILWHGDNPLAWYHDKHLVINLALNSSNLDRIPGTILMIRRYIESEQSRIQAFSSGNTGTSTRLNIPGATWMQFENLTGDITEKPYNGYMPNDAGIVKLFPDKESKEPIYKAAVYHADAREGDFSDASTFEKGEFDGKTNLERISSPDPLVPLWICLASIALTFSWLPGKQERRSA